MDDCFSSSSSTSDEDTKDEVSHHIINNLEAVINSIPDFTTLLTSCETRTFSQTNWRIRTLLMEQFGAVALYLNREYSLKYFSDESFPDVVDRRGTVVRGLNLSNLSVEADGLVVGGNGTIVYNFEWWDELENHLETFNLHTLDGSGCQLIKDAGPLRRITVLNLSGCTQLQNSSLAGIGSSFCARRSLNLSNCVQITDVSTLGNIYELDLSGCTGITDVSVLGRVHSLNLSGCVGITDISTLGDVRTLNLKGCENITCIQALVNVIDINLEGCYKAQSSFLSAAPLTILQRAQVVNVSFTGETGRKFLEDPVAGFEYYPNGDVHSLVLTAPKFPCAHTVDISNSYKLVNVQSLSHVRILNLQHCISLTDVSMLGGVYELDLSNCCAITDVSSLGGVHSLNLADCSGITDVSNLGRVHTLNLSGCYQITNVSKLNTVHTLNISGCKYIRNVSMLGSVYDLNMKGCTAVTDVSKLGQIHRLNIIGCTGITDISALDGVSELVNLG